MRSSRGLAIGLGMALAVALLPAQVSAGQSSAPNSGTWNFTDITPDPSNFGECMEPGVPSAPVDVNGHELKVTKKKATLSTTSHNRLDWAAEVRDSKGNIIASMDGSDPLQQESLTVPLTKGTYTVHYCNWAGEPQITVDWALK